MSYHQKKSRRSTKYCSECGWTMPEGYGADRVRWLPLFESFMCGDCEQRIMYENLTRVRQPQINCCNCASHPEYVGKHIRPCQRADVGDYDQNGSSPQGELEV